MSDSVGKEAYGTDIQNEKGISRVEDSSALDEKALAMQNKNAAIDAENAEHNMGVIDAVKAYPMAATWAFVMSCTIVSDQLIHDEDIDRGLQLTRSDHGGLLRFPHG
jgi:SP family general alpha glucoside:H+ symporter-like MFS transporter